ncbi:MULTISPECIES: DNA polymerase III subunit gamma/tau [Clostridium]|jgi:DNA polymerase III subunit gamma/tau|uniref:DNA-directed DNA polymerase n=1 Tax=Clostridium tertium TaxID=1559 RepID=A0A9X3XQQ2_9CLOT|nr:MULTISPECIES: DNA polymerase III subunit gamma/tau [Clostridium]EEH99753.1 DNA polymerase III, subunit gamma and tau [Clostridium sp. 7_2_43FAA]MBU6136933.1 DNA polymerase III subunit gamma/tau [Clostridium tertium]MDB1934897.1 DNA polymerase III subunit gamma/tau [Clostridium tertium]MDB1938643.1 DNA polymerase III subunit gamma/tau [Clostridium tertium]MDB1941205.1 DNA polymerase III subunit gamma/tau [Clostridium tertium]
MGYTALYREWRPQNFYDIVGQEHITTTVKNQILNDRIAHAYLFCGTRGTGKTTTAKVFAKALNCLDLKDGEPCNECEMCRKINDGLAIDVTELDAASNNGVDKIRDIIDDVKYPPQEARFKVYIMDEVHMLSTGAVNAFLKTLEEPPNNVIFILATTDPQKLPITILSRCQRFDFKRINNNEITERLRKIVNEQNALADDKSLNLIARVSDGAMRDALSILDQAISMGNGAVEYDVLINMLGLVTNDHLFNLTNSVIQRNVEKSIGIIDEVVYAGKDIYLFIKDLIAHYRNILMAKVTNNPEEVLDMSEENIALIKEQAGKIRAEEVMRYIRILQETESNAKVSKQARLYLELAVIKMCKIEYDTSNEVILTRINKLEEGLKNGSLKVVSAASTNKGDSKKEVVTNKPNREQPKLRSNDIVANENSKVTLNDIQRSWKDILERFKARRAMIVYASMLTGKPVECKNGVLTIEYEDQFKFNKDRLEKPEYRAIIQEVLAEIFREDIKIAFEVEEVSNNEKSTADMLLETLGSDMVDILDE